MSLVANRTAVNRRQTESERRARIQQRNAAYQQRRSDNKPQWLRERENRQREERTYLQEQQRRRVENGEWVDNVGGIRFKHADNRRSTPFIEGMNLFGALDSDSEAEEVPAVELFPALPVKSNNTQKPTLKDTAMSRQWASVVNTDPTEKKVNPPLSPPKLKRSVGDFIPQDAPSTPSKVCTPDATLLMAPKKKTILHPVRWGDDSDDEDDAPPEFSPTAYQWGDGAW
jgi:hypothetical protein